MLLSHLQFILRLHELLVHGLDFLSLRFFFVLIAHITQLEFLVDFKELQEHHSTYLDEQEDASVSYHAPSDVVPHALALDKVCEANQDVAHRNDYKFISDDLCLDRPLFDHLCVPLEDQHCHLQKQRAHELKVVVF